MGLFGPSKKEKALQAEVERLSSLMLPEHREIDSLNKQIELLKGNIVTLEKTIDVNQNKINELNGNINVLNQEILEKKKQISIFEVDIDAQEYGLYKPTFEFANSDLYKDKLKELRDRQKSILLM
ncbi:MAG: hypothetical protein IKY39_04280 [Clostridia bacterium]|nr:hypothetical protein [Clostridia bacterium]